MTVFIQLTDAVDGEKFYANPANILAFREDDGEDGGTILKFVGGETLSVTESPSQVATICNEVALAMAAVT